MWHLNTDERRAHLGAALGYLGEDETAPTYRVGRALFERTWQSGKWGGPDESCPEQDPGYLRAVCMCGWSSDVLVDLSVELPPDHERPAASRLHGQDRARAYWLAHALAATSTALPGGAEDMLGQSEQWLRTLTGRQPLACLSLARALREIADIHEGQAVRHARALQISWEDIGTAAGTTRQQMHRKHRGQPPLTDEHDILHPIHIPSYQHEDGHPPYTITETREREPP
ncbi:hypothetical protein ACFYXM_11200 [Streptomyces sp. NPDC002476]|uniref:hypothetical protein n=1 Tax=Streptomyces sp. NPDC002476 TaxID=3364648 RepID=UPI00367F05C8